MEFKYNRRNLAFGYIITVTHPETDAYVKIIKETSSRFWDVTLFNTASKSTLCTSTLKQAKQQAETLINQYL